MKPEPCPGVPRHLIFAQLHDSKLLLLTVMRQRLLVQRQYVGLLLVDLSTPVQQPTRHNGHPAMTVWSNDPLPNANHYPTLLGLGCRAVYYIPLIRAPFRRYGPMGLLQSEDLNLGPGSQPDLNFQKKLLRQSRATPCSYGQPWPCLLRLSHFARLVHFRNPRTYASPTIHSGSMLLSPLQRSAIGSFPNSLLLIPAGTPVGAEAPPTTLLPSSVLDAS